MSCTNEIVLIRDVLLILLGPESVHFVFYLLFLIDHNYQKLRKDHQILHVRVDYHQLCNDIN